MDLQFDKHGFLFPYEIINVDISTFETFFVNQFKGNLKRKNLFEAWKTYNNTLLSAIQPKNEIRQWIDGSFITTKLLPNDMDIVTFIHTKDCDNKKQILETFNKNNLYKDKGVDAYVVEYFPKEHSKSFFYQSDYLFWLHHFSKSRRNKKTGKRYDKGIVELNLLDYER